MKSYNGYRSWNAWNASLWLNNDYNLEMTMREYKDKGYTKAKIKQELNYLIGEKTPDGAIINKLAIAEFVNSHFE